MYAQRSEACQQRAHDEHDADRDDEDGVPAVERTGARPACW
jgi:hypothetical protein